MFFIFQITHTLTSHPRTKNVFVSTHAADSLPLGPRVDKPCAYIANTANWDQQGEHWVCFFFPKKGLPEYFDSFALDIPRHFANFLGSHFKQNHHIVQHPFSTACGQHVIYYIWQRCRGLCMEQILSLYTKNDYLINDVFVNQMIQQAFGVNLNVIDTRFINEQLNLRQ